MSAINIDKEKFASGMRRPQKLSKTGQGREIEFLGPGSGLLEFWEKKRHFEIKYATFLTLYWPGISRQVDYLVGL